MQEKHGPKEKDRPADPFGVTNPFQGVVVDGRGRVGVAGLPKTGGIVARLPEIVVLVWVRRQTFRGKTLFRLANDLGCLGG